MSESSRHSAHWPAPECLKSESFQWFCSSVLLWLTDIFRLTDDGHLFKCFFFGNLGVFEVPSQVFCPFFTGCLFFLIGLYKSFTYSAYETFLCYKWPLVLRRHVSSQQGADGGSGVLEERSLWEKIWLFIGPSLWN